MHHLRFNREMSFDFEHEETNRLLVDENENEIKFVEESQPGYHPGPRVPPKLLQKRPSIAHRGWHPKT